MKDLIKTLDEVVMKQVFDKDEHIIAINRAKNILENIDYEEIWKIITNPPMVKVCDVSVPAWQVPRIDDRKAMIEVIVEKLGDKI